MQVLSLQDRMVTTAIRLLSGAWLGRQALSIQASVAFSTGPGPLSTYSFKSVWGSAILELVFVLPPPSLSAQQVFDLDSTLFLLCLDIT